MNMVIAPLLVTSLTMTPHVPHCSGSQIVQTVVISPDLILLGPHPQLISTLAMTPPATHFLPVIHATTKDINESN